MLNDRRNRINTPTQEEEDDEISRPATDSQKKLRKYLRKKPSIEWEHVTKSGNEDKVQCNHCSRKWEGLNGSTSNPLRHIKEDHYDKLTDEQKKNNVQEW